MDEEPKEEKIIAYTRSGKPIYEKYNHVSNKDLTSTELQGPMFQFHDRAFYYACEMKKSPAGSESRERNREQMKHYEELYMHLGKLWRSALVREKKFLAKKR
jgi:hypothetical protein